MIAAAIGVPVAAAVVAFEVVLHGATSLLWHEIPDAFGWESPAAWRMRMAPRLVGDGSAVALTQIRSRALAS